MVFKLLKVIKYVLLKKIAKSIFLFLFIFLTAICIKLLMLDIYKIPSSSMNDTLYTNDVILVNKLKYGPKLPRSPFDIPWLNIAFYFNDKAKKRIKENWWKYHRLSGYSRIKNGDVLVYEYFSKNNFFVKRCVGIAGDTLAIKDGQIFINSKLQNFSNNIRNTYRFKITNKKQFNKDIDRLEIDQLIGKDLENLTFFKSSLKRGDYDKLKKLPYISNLQQIIASFDPKDGLFAKPQDNLWTKDNLGPIVIPKKGTTITLNTFNFNVYSTAINSHEKEVQIKHKNGQFIINGKEVTTYTFQQNYYFMMGDHRNGSYDSRFVGFIPEEKVVGKVQCILWSNYQDEFQWSRLFKSVN
nr:signal peptidase I [Polaribacter batillariae]